MRIFGGALLRAIGSGGGVTGDWLLVTLRLQDAEYTGHSLTMLERIATVCGVALELRAENR